MDYFGYGPRESYIDKRRASWLGRFTADVRDLHEDYIRPQENSSRFGCSELTVSDGETRILFTADEPFSFNASRYTQEELSGKRHNFELCECDSNVLCVDWRMAGVGSNSCGPALLPEYRVPLPHFEAQLHFKVE